MTNDLAIRRIASRAAANLVAVIAITAIFGLKAYIDNQARAHSVASTKVAAVAGSVYEPYFTEQP